MLTLHRRRTARDHALDLTRTTAHVALAAAQPLAAYFSEVTGKGVPEVERARRSDGPLTPAEGAFAIWAPLFAGSAALAVWSATGDRRSDVALRRIGALASAAYASNAAWSINAQLSGLGWRSLGLIASSVFNAGAALVAAERSFPRSANAQLATLAVGPLAGWLTLASFANLEATLNETRGRPSRERETWRAVGLLGAATIAAGATAIASRGNLPFAAAVGWGLGGTAVRNVRERRPQLTAAACVGLAVLAGTTWWARKSR